MTTVANDDRRRVALEKFRRSLLAAIEDMPAGYPGAEHDRYRFLTPVEGVIVELTHALADAGGKDGRV